MDNEVKGYKGNPRLLVKPLKVVLRSYLDGSGFCKGEVGSRAIKGMMIKLSVGQVRVKGSKLPIRPPVLLGGKGIDEVGGTGGKGTLHKFRWDY